MKAVIVEIRGKYVAALSHNGCITQLKNKNYALGQVIEMKKLTVKRHAKIAACVASIAAFVSLSGITAWAYYTPYSYVSLDVNPSIEYSVNRFDRVLDVNAVNDDGAAILEDLNLTNKPIGDAVQETVQEIADQGYITDAELGGIVIAASSGDDSKSEQLAEELKSDAEQAIEDKGLEAQVEAQGIGYARVQEAKAMGVTPGKLNLVQKLQASAGEETVDVEAWLKQPVKSIMKAIKENKKEENAVQEPAGTDSSSEDAQTASSAVADTQDDAASTQNNADKAKNTEQNKNANAEQEKNANAEKKQDALQANTTDTTSESSKQSADAKQEDAAGNNGNNASANKNANAAANGNGTTSKAENQKSNNGKAQ